MKYIASFCLMLIGIFSTAQKDSGRPILSSASATGSVYIPTLQSINIDIMQDRAVEFSTVEEYDHGKFLPGFIKATVISNVPYLVSIMASGASFSSDAGDARPMPISVISLRDNISNQFVNLSATAKPLLLNKSNQIQAVYLVDAYFNPGWDYSGGQYNTTLSFTLTAQ